VEPPKILKGKFGKRLFIGFELALFADAGSVWRNSAGPDNGEFMTGYGIGLRLLMPYVNVIRLDLLWENPEKALLLILE
jgi:hemolysin activation/secretion protein